MREFRLSRKSRDMLNLQGVIAEIEDDVIFVSMNSAREFTFQLSKYLLDSGKTDFFPKSSELYAIALIHEVFHYLISLYQIKYNPDAFTRLHQTLEKSFSSNFDETLEQFVHEFPPNVVYNNEISASQYVTDPFEKESNIEQTIEEIILLRLFNENPAMKPYKDYLFSDDSLQVSSQYIPVFKSSRDFFLKEPVFGNKNQTLIEFLETPFKKFPNSIFDQLEYIRTHWAHLIGEYLSRLLSGMDFLKEESKTGFHGPGEVLLPDKASLMDMMDDRERYSRDSDWMKNLVLIAKNTYVWLYQLSLKYQRSIKYLNEIPDEELQQLASWGISGLWLIGIWERSSASEEIKKRCGNPDAISSAYSLKNYEIAEDLGGYLAYKNLKERAEKYHIRLASDMVPNHMGIDSPWVMEHPDWFLQTGSPPFPSYTFNSEELSPYDPVAIRIEDHYYDKTDAAVVFEWKNKSSGETRYLYHGNDGTSMPWNDTAQLDYLNPEVREQVIQTILEVAKKFQIIRFDAAMTLTRKHYKRLWFPEPGKGGDIPSRAGQGLSTEDFNEQMPREFWHEVVERVEKEVPDTLLLAEAFWLMESYFVRNLGMHRVYNSAFMNLLRNEDNNKYRGLITNILEFDPKILNRYVNFMNNPDEKTAVDQFGKGDKYFGICTLLATMPGLPMLGHGQIEGYSEKYGMEFKRSYWNEGIDFDLVNRHQQQIFPILHRRFQFSGSDNFLLYNFFSPEGHLNENVFAYSNGEDGIRNLVIFHNKFAEVKGWIKSSTPKAVPDAGHQIKSLSEGLNLDPACDFVILRDHRAGLEYLRSREEIENNGLYFELHAYQCLVFMDIWCIRDDSSNSYRKLYDYLNGRGVQNIEDEKYSLILSKLHQGINNLLQSNVFTNLKNSFVNSQPGNLDFTEKTELSIFIYQILNEAAELSTLPHKDINLYAQSLQYELIRLGNFANHLKKPFYDSIRSIPRITNIKKTKKRELVFYFLVLVTLTKQLSTFLGKENISQVLDEYRLHHPVFLNISERLEWSKTQEMLLGIASVSAIISSFLQIETEFKNLLASSTMQNFLEFNQFEDALWFNKEKMEMLQDWIEWMAFYENYQLAQKQPVNSFESIPELIKKMKWLKSIIKKSGYQVKNLIKLSEKTFD